MGRVYIYKGFQFCLLMSILLGRLWFEIIIYLMMKEGSGYSLLQIIVVYRGFIRCVNVEYLFMKSVR